MRYTMQAIALLLALLFGIVIGVGSAETNIQEIQGNPDSQRAVQVTPDQQGRVEIAVLGHVYETDHTGALSEVKEKKKETSETAVQLTDASNSWLSKAGNGAGQSIREVTRVVVEKVVGWVGGSEN
ncbi:DUF3679 domain-containing protein [Marininema halotolerans]|nr:DUF3679 domain-containing protein [Marininema halotolerans]